MPNGPVFKCHLNTRQPNHLNTEAKDAILFSYELVQYQNVFSIQIPAVSAYNLVRCTNLDISGQDRVDHINLRRVHISGTNDVTVRWVPISGE